jgi:hypothetical protein
MLNVSFRMMLSSALPLRKEGKVLIQDHLAVLDVIRAGG